jgi:hypothetical protein
VLAFNSPDLAHPVNDWSNTIFKRFDIDLLGQALENVVEVEARVSMDYLHQHLSEDVLAELAGLIGQLEPMILVNLPERVHHTV